MRLHSVTPEDMVNLVVTAERTYISQVICMVNSTICLRVSDMNNLNKWSLLILSGSQKRAGKLFVQCYYSINYNDNEYRK